jgi:hypothetical protein
MSNVVTNALSHPVSGIAAAVAVLACATIADRAPFDLKEMDLHEMLCPRVQTLCSSTGMQIVTQKVGDLEFIGDAATGTFLPLVPRDLRQQVFNYLHRAASPGMQTTRCLITSSYLWKGLSTDVIA